MASGHGTGFRRVPSLKLSGSHPDPVVTALVQHVQWLGQCIKERTPMSVSGGKLRSTGDGFILSGGRPANPAGSEEVCPLTLTGAGSGGATGNSRIKFVSGGTVGGRLPSNMTTSGGDLWSEDVSSGWSWVVAKVQSGAGVVTGVTLDKISSPPAPIGALQGQPPTSFDVPLYAVYSQSGKFRLFRLFGCGGITLTRVKALSYEKAAAGCGVYPLLDVWTWEVSSAA